MPEPVVNRRKSLFLPFAPIAESLDERIRPELQPGEFPLTKTAWIKTLSILILVTAIGLFASQSLNSCENPPNWFQYLLPITLGINTASQLILYLIFSFGLTVNRPGVWIQSDIIANLAATIGSLTGCIMSFAAKVECKENPSMHSIPLVTFSIIMMGDLYLGVAGAGVSIVGCAAIFLMYRYVELEENNTISKSTKSYPTISERKKSVFA